MPAGFIKVTPEQLHAVSSQLNGGASAIDATLSQLAGAVAPLGTDWAGAAQGRFMQLFEQWRASQRQLHQALSEMAVLMNRAAGAYAEGDANIAATFVK